MNAISQFMAGIMALFLMLTITACAPEVGSDAWCENMKATSTGDWTANQVADYAQHCLLK